MDPSTFATLASVGLNLFGANQAQDAATINGAFIDGGTY